MSKTASKGRTASIAPLKRPDARRSNRLAWLVVEGQDQRFHAAMRDYADDGARLTVSGLMGIPDRFFLYVEPDSIRYNCSVLERLGNTVRVEFIARAENVRFRDDRRA
ncbi:MAG: hypothetical protein R3D35_07930 [Nitratireductor sp.]